MRVFTEHLGRAAKSFSDLLIMRFYLHQCLERHLGVQWEVPPLEWIQVVTVRQSVVRDLISYFFFFESENDGSHSSGSDGNVLLKIWFPLVSPHFFSKTATWAALFIAKVNLDIKPEILTKTRWYRVFISL